MVKQLSYFFRMLLKLAHTGRNNDEATPGAFVLVGFGVSKISTASLFVCCVYTGEQGTFMGILLLPIPGLEQARVFLFPFSLQGRCVSLSRLTRALLFISFPCSFTRGSQEGTFCALCFIAGDDTITTDTPREHKLKEV